MIKNMEEVKKYVEDVQSLLTQLVDVSVEAEVYEYAGTFCSILAIFTDGPKAFEPLVNFMKIQTELKIEEIKTNGE